MEISVFFTNPILCIGYIIALLALFFSLLFTKNMILPTIAFLLFTGVMIYAFFAQAELSHILIAIIIALVPNSILLYIRGKKT